MKDHPHIFNLGHGILPETDPDVLAAVIERVKQPVA
jgi:uroporphyrinogen decarboxylase